MEQIEMEGALFLDANLLLLFVIGTMDRSLISRFKRTQEFSVEDFDELAGMVGRANKVVTTPHILTEVSNLANSLRDDQKDAFAATFRLLIKVLDERFTTANVLSDHALFRFGLADVSVIPEVNGLLFLTQDGRFASQVIKYGGVGLDLKTAIAIVRNNA